MAMIQTSKPQTHDSPPRQEIQPSYRVLCPDSILTTNCALLLPGAPTGAAAAALLGTAVEPLGAAAALPGQQPAAEALAEPGAKERS